MIRYEGAHTKLAGSSIAPEQHIKPSSTTDDLYSTDAPSIDDEEDNGSETTKSMKVGPETRHPVFNVFGKGEL